MVGTYVCNNLFYNSNQIEIRRFYDESQGMWEYRWKNPTTGGTNGAWFGATNGALTCSHPGEVRDEEKQKSDGDTNENDNNININNNNAMVIDSTVDNNINNKYPVLSEETDVSESERVGQVFLDRAGWRFGKGAGLPPGKDTFTSSRQ